MYRPTYAVYCVVAYKFNINIYLSEFLIKLYALYNKFLEICLRLAQIVFVGDKEVAHQAEDKRYSKHNNVVKC
jgi:hypothetical protein